MLYYVMTCAVYQFLRRRQAPTSCLLPALSALFTLLWQVAFSPTAGFAFPLTHPASIAMPHCEALLAAIGNGDSADMVPDMGFVIGARWQTLTRKQRIEVSAAMVEFITATIPQISGIDAPEGCILEFNISLLPGDEKEAAAEGYLPGAHDFPRLPRYRATARMALPGVGALTYILDKQGNYIWEIKEMIIGKTALNASYGNKLNRILAQQGVGGLVKWLKDKTLRNA